MTGLFANESLKLLELQVQVEVESPITWNSFPGSVLHGALGFTVKQRTCIAKDEKCSTCRLQNDCMYPRLFESRTPEDTERMRKYPRIPPGLRLTVEPWHSPVLKPKAKFNIGLTLLGRTIDDIGLLLLALEDMLQQGIGRKSLDGDRGTAEIVSISQLEAEPILWRELNFTRSLPIKSPHWSEIPSLKSDNFKMEFTTPARIVSKGHVTSKPTFKDIFSTTLRRVSNIAYFYCGLELDADFKGLVKIAESVEFTSTFRRSEQTRYSARQKKRMEFDGILGRINLLECPEELLPWLEIGAKLGIGKNTSMGMGNYIVSENI